MQTHRFQMFFTESAYLTLKNELYNYRLRRRAVARSLAREHPAVLLELGSGISPMVAGKRGVVYCDLSPAALQVLRPTVSGGCFVVADARHLPFKTGSFTHTVCAEMLEHVDDDRLALAEICRTLVDTGRLVVTFPHRKAYFSADDRYVRHWRRYDRPEMLQRLRKAGFAPAGIRKVLGPLEKVTMWLAVLIYPRVAPLLAHRGTGETAIEGWRRLFRWLNLLYMGLAWCDACAMPMELSAVLLIEAEKYGATKG